MLRLSSVVMLWGIAVGNACAAPTKAIVHEVEFNGCRFKIMDSYGGSLKVSRYSPPKMAFYNYPPNPNARHAVEVSIRFTCDTKDGWRAFTELGFDKQNGKWKLLPNKYDPENSAKVKLYPLTGKGTDGAASTDDQTTGDESRRTQGLAFCLTDQKQILCGTSEAVGYVAYPKASSLPQVLKLLESIEFLEPSATSP
ncbi:hypothetical protein [Pseudomonas panipatensis]|nr:hypothetical protein [Pseudomonas panipatensis]